MKIYLELECLSDVVMTAQSGSVGGYESLGYLRGGSILGAVAARCYGRLGTPDADWKIFHDGSVRFGDAWPVSPANAASWPVPLSFHKVKGEDAGRERLIAERVANRAVAGREAGVQYQQIRDRAIDTHGSLANLPRRRSMRTAIAPDGRVRDAYLYELDAIGAGARLRCIVESDDDALLAHVTTALIGNEINLGRARSAEFGRALVRYCAPFERPASTDHHTRDRVLFWCLSDVCLLDSETLQPTLRPSAVHFGLSEGWHFDPKHSFLRTRQYSPFNGARRRPDAERQVLVAGSVLSFRGPGLDAENWERVRRHASAGVGEHRAEGLGVVVFEPRILQSVHPVFDLPGAEPTPPTTIEAPDDDLAKWVGRQTATKVSQEKAWSVVRELLREIEGARAWRDVSPAQWGELRRLARENRERSRQEILDALDGFFLEGVRALQHRWGALRGGETLGMRLRRVIEAEDTIQGMLVLELVATHAVRAQRRRGADEAGER